MHKTGGQNDYTKRLTVAPEMLIEGPRVTMVAI